MIQSLREKFGKNEFKKQVHQVVSIIFKNIPGESPSILILERVQLPNKLYSGDLCFPGGNIDQGETPDQAVIREVLQETNINLKEVGSFIGKLNHLQETKNTIQKKFKKTTYVGYYLHEINQPVQVKINPDQIVNYFWIPFTIFLKFTKEQMIFSHKALKFKHNQIEGQKIKYFKYAAFDIGLQKKTHGATFQAILEIIENLSQVPDISDRIGFEVTNDYYWKVADHFATAFVEYGDGKKQIEPIWKFYKAFLMNKVLEHKPKL